MANKEFSNEIRILRRNNNLTMQEFADQLGVTKGAVSMWENKGVVPRDDILMRISKNYGISLDKLLGNNIDDLEVPEGKLSYIQRNLGKLDNEQLKKAENVLKIVFDDIFDDDFEVTYEEDPEINFHTSDDEGEEDDF